MFTIKHTYLSWSRIRQCDEGFHVEHPASVIEQDL